jgi:molybdopterin converting factor small subunit
MVSLRRPLPAALVFPRGGWKLKINVRAASQLADFVPPSGGVDLREGSKVSDLLEGLRLDGELVMLVVVDGELADMDSPLHDGAAVELIPPVSGG